MMEVTAPVLALAVMIFGGLLAYVFHLHHKLAFMGMAMNQMFHAKLEKLDIPDGTTVKVIFD